jgi:hypothetical protein
MSSGGTAATPPRNLLERGKSIEEQVQRIEVRSRTDSDDGALNEALEAFEKQRELLKPVVEQVGGLRGSGAEVEIPDPAKLIRGLEKLAGDIDADPQAVRRRRNQLNQLEKLVTDSRQVVGRVVQARLREAKGDANPNLVGVLRIVGLEGAADKLEVALEELDRLAVDGPRATEDWQRVDAAAATIHDAVSESGTPLLEFTHRVLGGSITLADLDPGLLAELKQVGAAKNFAIKLSSR